MPVKKKLDQKKLDKYKKLLIDLKRTLVHDIRNMAGASGSDSSDVSGHVQHMADVATDLYDKEFTMGLASHDRETLQRIDDALIRIEKGTYGFCLGTEKPISAARLTALPYAEHCLSHQEELEEKGEV
ncbi:MAG: DnaK suppressor protein [Lysobacterales bacterium]|jgi:DnaK suppressor protein